MFTFYSLGILQKTQYYPKVVYHYIKWIAMFNVFDLRTLLNDNIKISFEHHPGDYTKGDGCISF